MVSYAFALLALLSKETGVMAIPINVVLGLTMFSQPFSSSAVLVHHPPSDKRNRLASTKLKLKRLALDFAVVSTGQSDVHNRIEWL